MKDGGGVWLVFIENESCSPLVIQLSHVISSLIGVLDVRERLLEWLVCGSRHEVDRYLFGSWMVILKLLHMHELGVFGQLGATAWLERPGTDVSLLWVLAEEVLTSILILITNGVGLKLLESFGSG